MWYFAYRNKNDIICLYTILTIKWIQHMSATCGIQILFGFFDFYVKKVVRDGHTKHRHVNKCPHWKNHEFRK